MSGGERVEVFVRSWLPGDRRDKLRALMTELCITRWRMQADADVRPLWLGDRAKQFAEENAAGDVYIIADDDCVPIGREFVARGVATLHDNADYGILTACSVIEHHRYTDDTTSPEVVELHSVGGIAFVRRGILREFAACDPGQTDEVICSEIVRRGYRTGIMPHVKMNHIGYGYSITAGVWSA